MKKKQKQKISNLLLRNYLILYFFTTIIFATTFLLSSNLMFRHNRENYNIDSKIVASEVMKDGEKKLMLLITVPESEYLSNNPFTSKKNYWHIVIIIMLFYVFSLILSLYAYSKLTAKTFLQPLNQLIDGTKKITSGDYSSRINLNVDNEFGELSDAFNKMAEKIDNEIIARNSKEKKLTNKASIDQHTGIYNRYAGLEILEKEFNSAIENNTTLSICFIDLNNLKYVNDNYGHNIGDDYIKECVQIIKNEINEEDIFMRLGGDEFLIGFIETPYVDAEEVWQRIKYHTDSYNDKNIKEYELSMSHGIESLYNNNFQSMKEFIDSADIKMYKEKKKIKSM